MEVVALPVLPGSGEGGSVLLGPGADEVADELGVDLLGVLEAERATGEAGEVTICPVPLGGAGDPALRLVLLVGVGEAVPARPAPRRRRAGPCRPRP